MVELLADWFDASTVIDNSNKRVTAGRGIGRELRSIWLEDEGITSVEGTLAEKVSLGHTRAGGTIPDI